MNIRQESNATMPNSDGTGDGNASWSTTGGRGFPSRRACLQSLLATMSAGLQTQPLLSSQSPMLGSDQAEQPRNARPRARIAITLDLEMSANFPNWQDTHWNYDKGNLDQPTREYAVEAARRVHAAGGHIHFFCVGRVLEQADISWLQQLSRDGHPIGNHTYDHINLLASTLEELQFRFRRSPWLLRDKTVPEAIRENIQLTSLALKQRAGIDVNGFRTPGGFPSGLSDRPDVRQLLRELGFQWISSKYPRHANSDAQQQPSDEVFQNIVAAQASAQPFLYADGMLEIPMSPISDIGAFRTGRWQLDWFLEAIQRSVAWVIRHGAVFDFLAHPSCLVVTDPDFRTIDLLCQLVRQNASVARLTTLEQIAAEYTTPAAGSAELPQPTELPEP